MAPPVKPVALAPLTPLAAGDFVPPFCLPDQAGKKRELQHYGGKRVAIFFLPLEVAHLAAFSAAQAEFTALEIQSIAIFRSDSEKLAAFREANKGAGSTWADAGGVARCFGLADDAPPTAFILNENHRLLAQVGEANAPALTAAALALLKSIGKQPALVFDGSIPHAPLLTIPELLPDALCGRLLEYWAGGKQYAGALGSGVEKGRVETQTKRRMDVDIHEHALLVELDRALAKRLLPELRKVVAFEAKYREHYKVGRYGEEDKGFYAAHRDTTVPALAYRRWSLSIGLSNDYEGGLLQFPEYGNCGYKLTRGMGLCFPSTLMHRIIPVTKGERFVIVSFLYGEAEAAHRRAVFKREGKSTSDTPLLCGRRFTGITESDGLYSASLDRK